MDENEGPITKLGEQESWDLLASMALGRLVTSAGGQPEIFPVNYVVQRHTVLFRTAEGTKLLTAVMNDRVAFEADEHNVEEGWSVVVKGRAQALTSRADIEEAERAQLLPWTPTLKLCYVRIIPTEITGRRFRFGTEPDRSDVLM
jgi:nitroimidazol reductase NimA-like FMN-containing flavoprotein (pyridoxamine 5'-phosphate oxidase superfamily)